MTGSNSKFDYEKCRWVNAEHLRRLEPELLVATARPFLEKAGIDPGDPRVPDALALSRERVQTLAEIPGIVGTIFADAVSYDEASLAKVKDRADLPQVVSALADAFEDAADWTPEGIKAAVASAAEGLGTKMGALMLPCRVAATGSAAGADLVPVLALLGKAETVKRLRAFGSQMA